LHLTQIRRVRLRLMLKVNKRREEKRREEKRREGKKRREG
jgi:hypothetical protein